MQHVVSKSPRILLMWLFLNGKVWISASETSDSGDSKGQTVCLFRNSRGPEAQFHVEGLTFVSGCQFCYATWRVHPSHGFHILEQGCSRNISAQECNSSQCIVPQGEHYDDFFYCCSQHKCNQILVQVGPLKEEFTFHPGHLLLGLVIALSICVPLMVLTSKLRATRPYAKFDLEGSKPASTDISEPLFVVEKVTLERNPGKYIEIAEVIHNGAFSNIHRGFIRTNNSNKELNVAIKVFPPKLKELYDNIKAILEMGHLQKHSQILNCFAGYPGLKQEHFIVLEYCPFGTLDTYLRGRTLTWKELCQILAQITQGLAALHGEYCQTPSVAICHRDLNSRNILVTYGLRCCITGLELAIIFNRGKPKPSPTSGDGSRHGVIRYLAPELLDGALNLRNFQTSLKQVDVYALGLLFWEVANRCRDIYQEIPVPLFQLAFEAELESKTPSVKQMQILVLHNKARPVFSGSWESVNPGIQLLKETMAYCWDGDAEARLTTLGVIERVREMDSLWIQHVQISGLEVRSDQAWTKGVEQKQFEIASVESPQLALLMDRLVSDI
ncbi:hypothetical protein TCAL_13708 [Tigriopus californicus]|uniref:receptor protein serine/threonine kinase n=1 Tax=Tigriopus californicus TaxID=6832 RepID=A0A553NEH9_TIGCA|nr:bone morphogenetic protein receptor type-2-like [Tigriopus californicus]TRY63853.1 hypothetical protein TCAL_13708 [Tigriopus californicus]|eukprot:TCALIF_13708-PA protein Name:"Similar to BMPR2 Bone morphogenetic protein receptor type-2 (Homo sapiens)" AED:0.03 eAED:0.03 QI:446/1/1/1/0.5/0.55/9/380/555